MRSSSWASNCWSVVSDSRSGWNVDSASDGPMPAFIAARSVQIVATTRSPSCSAARAVAPDMDVDQALDPAQVRHHDRAQRLVELDAGGSETEQPDDGPVAHGWASPPNPPGSGRRTATRWYPAVERFAAQNAARRPHVWERLAERSVPVRSGRADLRARLGAQLRAGDRRVARGDDSGSSCWTSCCTRRRPGPRPG